MPTYYIGLTVLATRQCGEDYLISDEKESLYFFDPGDGIVQELLANIVNPVKHILIRLTSAERCCWNRNKVGRTIIF